jgi:hypothetical protein
MEFRGLQNVAFLTFSNPMTQSAPAESETENAIKAFSRALDDLEADLDEHCAATGQAKSTFMRKIMGSAYWFMRKRMALSRLSVMQNEIAKVRHAITDHEM